MHLKEEELQKVGLDSISVRVYASKRIEYIYEETAEAMETVIPDLVKAGYQLVTVSEMLTLLEGGAIAGTVYRSVN